MRSIIVHAISSRALALTPLSVCGSRFVVFWTLPVTDPGSSSAAVLNLRQGTKSGNARNDQGGTGTPLRRVYSQELQLVAIDTMNAIPPIRPAGPLHSSGRIGRARRRLRRVLILPAVWFVLTCAVTMLHAQGPTFQIASATFGTGSAIPAGINGATLQLTGTLPSAMQQQQTSLLACFYTGYGSTAGIPLAVPNGANTEPLAVPASTIQSIPESAFTPANGYTVIGLVYFIQATSVCDGTFDASLTNQYAVPVVAPSIVGYAGPVSIPQTNPATSVQAPPTELSLPISGVTLNGVTGGSTTVTFGSFGSIALSAASHIVAVPAAFASSPVGTTAALSVCNTYATGAGNTVCTTPTPPLVITVTALTASMGTVTASPDPVLTSGQTTLSAQFAQNSSASPAASPGAPSGLVTFTAPGATLPPAKLILDTTATFASQTTSVTTPVAATPVIAPAGGNFTAAQTISITDATPGAAIFYTQDGSAPTTASTPYTAPFQISTSQTIQAIAAVAGDLNSAVATAAFSITISPPTQLAFAVQPVNTPLNSPITPPVQVAVEDVNGMVVTSSTAAVKLAFGRHAEGATLSGTLTQNAVNGIATFSDLAISTIANGYSLIASSPMLASATSNMFNITPAPITITTQSELVGIGSTLNGSFTLGAPAPAGGVVVTLSSSAPANVTIAPATVNVAAGQTTGTFTYTGVAAGDATLSASATGYVTGTVMATGTAAQVSLGMIPPVAPAQMESLALSLATPAPAGGTTVSFTIANPSIASVTSSVFVPAGQQTAATNPQVTGILIGTTTVTANAPGYAPASRPVDVTVVASFNPGTTQINLSTSTNTTLTISAPAPPGGIKFTLSTDDATVATVPPSITIVQGATSVNVPITGVAAGNTTIRADSPGITEATGAVYVYSAINGGNFTTGYDLQGYINLYLPVNPPNPVTVTVTSNNPAVAKISSNGSAVGQTTLTFPNTTSNYIGTVYIQGISVGTTTLTISAPGYTNGTTAVTVDQSGFVYYYDSNFSTTTFSAPTSVSITTVALNSDLSTYDGGYTINPGSAPISVPITSSSTSVGTVTSPVVFQPGDSSDNFTFTPVGVGTTNLTIGTPPAGFSATTKSQQIVATVTAPAISLGGTNTGTNLTNTIGIYLPVAPPSPVTVTVTTGSPAVATLSTSATAVGSSSVTFTNVSGNYAGTLYVQGQSPGTATLTESAPGYTSGTSSVTVGATGFFIAYPGNFNTTTFSQPTSVQVLIAEVDPTSGAIQNYYLPVSPGVAPITLQVTDSATSVGTISPTSLVFNPGDNNKSFNFQPVAAGTANLTLVTPAGYKTANQAQQITATVTAPAISVGGVLTGVHQQNSIGIYLPVPPPNPVTVTVTTSAPLVGTLSNSSTVAGVTTVTFTNVSSTYVGTIYVQGQSVGTATITESAPGYTTGTNTITVNPSGFFWYYGNGFTTTTFSGPTTEYVFTAVLDPTSSSIQTYGLGLNPGVGPVTVAIADSAPSVGTISANSVVFNTGDGSQIITFQPVSAGSANLTLSTPAGFTTPAQSQQITATVTAPQISVSNVTTGVNLEAGVGIYLPVSPPNPVTVTVTSSGPAIATIASDGTTVGGSSLTFTNVTGTYVGTIYVQGQSLGTALLTETAPGYTDGSGTITVDPAGFVFYGTPNFSTSVNSNPTGLTVYASVLDPGSLTVQQFNLGVNPGIGNVDVTVVSSDTSVGTISTSPLVFTPSTGFLTTNFVPVAAGTATITIQTPTGFSTPSQFTQATATVQNP